MTPPQLTSLEESIRDELSAILGKKIDLETDAELKEEGVDSIATIKLIINLEIRFGIQIDDDDMLIHNFSTIQAISSLLSEKYDVAS